MINILPITDLNNGDEKRIKMVLLKLYGLIWVPLYNPVMKFANVDVKSSAVEGVLVNSQIYLALQDVAALAWARVQ